MSVALQSRLTTLAFPGRLRLSPTLVSITLLALSLAAGLRAALAWTHGQLIYAVDDAYIHMAVAKNLAHDGIWGCTPFHFSSSSSSLLWTTLLGVAYRVFGVHDVTPLVLNVAVAVLALWVTDRYLVHFAAPPLLRTAALLGLVVAFPMAGMVLIGMEHILHLLLTVWFAAAAVEALSSEPVAGYRHRQTLGLALLSAALGASRYEGVFLVAVVCVAFLARRQLVRALTIGAAALLPIAAFGAISVANGGFFLPNSLMLKAAGESVSVLSALLRPFGQEDLAFLQRSHGLVLLLAICLAGALVHWHRQHRVWRAPVLLPLWLLAMVVLHGHFVFSPTFWVYRYDAYLTGFGVFVAAVVLAELRLPRLLAGSWWPACLVATLVLAVSDVKEGLFPDTEVGGIRNTYLEHYQAAEFIRRYYAGEVVIVNDLGAVSYYTQTRILDLVGLGDVEPLEFMRRTGDYTSTDVQTWTARYRPAIAIIQLGWSWIVPRVPREWIKVAEVEVPPHGQRIGFFAVEAKDSLTLRASVEQHYAPLARPLGYRLRLGQPPP
jgi:hypothetical protein